MKPTEELLRQMQIMSDGEDVAYVDIARRRFKGERGFDVEKNSKLLSNLEPGFEKLFAENGWKTLTDPETFKKYPKSTALFFCGGIMGLGLDAAAGAIDWVYEKTGFGKPRSTLGILESITGNGANKPIATLKIPREKGGWDRQSFRIVSYPEIMRHIGMGVEFIPRAGAHRPRLRPLSPPSTLEKVNGEQRLKNLSAIEIALVVSAHNQSKDFAGQWEKKKLPNSHNGMKCLSHRLAGLFVHNVTKEGILVFRGTQPSSISDWIVNVKTTHGAQSYQHKQSIATVEAAKKECAALMLAGHSKGGGISQYAACLTGTPAVTFNSVGLASSLVKELSGGMVPRIDHFMTRFDIVSNVTGNYDAESMGIAGPGAFRKGERQPLIGGPQCFHFLPPPTSRIRFCALHSLEAVQETLHENPHIITAPTCPTRPAAVKIEALNYLDRAKTPEYEYYPPSNTTFDRETEDKKNNYSKDNRREDYYRFEKPKIILGRTHFGKLDNTI